jgi:hypothetical protein
MFLFPLRAPNQDTMYSFKRGFFFLFQMGRTVVAQPRGMHCTLYTREGCIGEHPISRYRMHGRVNIGGRGFFAGCKDKSVRCLLVCIRVSQKMGSFGCLAMSGLERRRQGLRELERIRAVSVGRCGFGKLHNIVLPGVA